jgi:hypothetical protein
MRAVPGFLAAGVFLFGVGLKAQSAAPETQTAAPAVSAAERMTKASDVNSIDGTGLEPWHLKIDVEMLDGRGNTSGKGTLEEWWAKDDMYRLTYTLGAETLTQLRTRKEGSVQLHLRR